MPAAPSHITCLDVVIVGGGIGGLTVAYCLGRSGHRITIIEQEPWLEEVGAGIQLAPNASRLLIRWGLGSALDKLGVKPEAASFNRFKSDERIGFNYIGVHFEAEHGAPYYHIHRTDLTRMMYDLGKAYITIKAGKVVRVLPGATASHSPSVVLESGDVITADMVIGADGVKSTVRKYVVDGTDIGIPTGDMAYRALIPSEEMTDDEDLCAMTQQAEVTCWMGPGRHIVGYFVREMKLYNLVMIRQDILAEESWSAEASTEEIRESFQEWNCRVRKLTALARGIKKSKLVIRPPLRTWIDTTGRIALLGDACHAMLPYLAQGAAIAIEDAAVLGRLFAEISDKSQIPELLKGYQNIRVPRATATQRASHANQERFHLPDGPLQQARDAAMKEAMKVTLAHNLRSEGGTSVGNKSIVLDHDKQLAALQFNYDAEAEAEDWMRSHRSNELVVKTL